jgi:hypothetical protein
MAVTFPSPGVIVEYSRPAPSDPQTVYQQIAQEFPSDQVIDLGGAPALEMPQNSDATGANMGGLLFVDDGTEVTVMGHYDLQTLQGLAQSLQARASSSS